MLGVRGSAARIVHGMAVGVEVGWLMMVGVVEFNVNTGLVGDEWNYGEYLMNGHTLEYEIRVSSATL